jgi:hypothetical protein
MTKVPSESTYFDKFYREKKTTGLPKGIDVNSVYVEDYYLGFNNERFEIKDRFIVMYRFYSNGSISKFLKSINLDLKDISLNPDSTGYRGICFKKDKIWYLDLVAPVTENRSIGTYDYEFVEITPDTIKIKRVRDYIIYVYKRVSLDEKNRQFTGNW